MRSKEDWIFWSEVSRGSFPAILNEPVCGYVMHGANMTRVRNLQSALQWLQAFLVVHKNLPRILEPHEKPLIHHFLRFYWDRISSDERKNFRERQSFSTDAEFFLKDIITELNV
jgi:hypothetical protein